MSAATHENTLVAQLDGLTRHFGEVQAVNGLSFSIERGEVFGLLGHNGAGKTTTVRLLNGVLTPTSGVVEVLGVDPVREGAQLRRKTGVLTENPSLDERLSARENLTIYADLYGVPQDDVQPRISALLERFELGERAAEKVGGYSKGMKQRLALARALLHAPEMLFLDEPTSGLDPVAAREVRDLVTHLSQKEGRTVVLCTHNLYEAQRLCHRVAVLEHGRLLALGTPADLSARLGGKQRLLVEIDPAQAQLAAQTLAGLPGIVGVEAGQGEVSFGGAEHERIPAVVAALAGAGVSIYRVEPLQASLEDVYFALHDE